VSQSPESTTALIRNERLDRKSVPRTTPEPYYRAFLDLHEHIVTIRARITVPRNDELRSANEELETSKEELQAARKHF
jgi:hypothetical protein